MRHFTHLAEADQRRLFSRRPEPFARDSAVPALAMSLGATLYMPATREHLASDLTRQAARGLTSAVVCLEDAVPDAEVPAAQAHAVAELRELATRIDGGPSGDAAPLVFIRVRHPEQIGAIVERLGDRAGVLTGFVLPKFTESTGPAFLDALTQTATSSGRRLLAMPVLESPELIHRETRQGALLGIQQLLEKHRPDVLAVRIGATDLSGVYGIRRDRDLTVYDVRLLADFISDVVNMLARSDGTGHVVTGPVWEYFPSRERLFKPQLRQTPFEAHHARSLRHTLLDGDLDGLIREAVLDRSNGLTGKTVIHPAHVGAVHALSVVTSEEFEDATDISAAAGTGGVAASRYANKMNESKPHRAWAERTLLRARAFGVAQHGTSLVDLLSALTSA